MIPATAAYARREVTLLTLVGAALSIGLAWLAGWWGVAPAAVFLALLAFYRDPPRRIPDGDDLLLAPADGRIVALDQDADRTLRIMIFLSVLDVHLNRAPCAGRVVAVIYQPGEFVNALRRDADTRNESNTVVLAPHAPLPGPIHLRQIAGVLARRIVCTLQPGQEVAAGERFGMIKLGSRTELRLPDDDQWEVCVRVGQSVRAGTTILARRRNAT